ncbi:MAG: LysM peptidoglycan-binding domain-containing protein [Deltaproteobacteria bacterium]|jgi:LysM repeat protein|nr:LysM peptidoglycan-binding domain-containing protein [Deltaproteobacteria bacterium]MBW2482266.1 LysM peptidoglycan-binding domain-containing protein [Deltaproteobacteria bacterium]
MVDSPKDRHEDFVISQEDDMEEEQGLGQEEYYGNQTSILQNKSNLTYIIGGVGLVLIVVLLIFALAGPSDEVDRQQLQALEERIAGLEKRLATIGLIDQALVRIDNNEKELSLIMERVDRFEGTVSTQIDQIIKELGKLHQKTGSAPAANVKTKQPVAQSTPEKQAAIHEVRAGDTLYSISRRYGLTVDQLRTYNNIGQDAAIRPGQKLKLSPP